MNTDEAGTTLSVPAPFRAPRSLTEAELRTLRAIADHLVPAVGDNPAATAEPGLDDALRTAIDARADAFDEIVDVLAGLVGAGPQQVADTMRDLHAHHPKRFQPLSAVVVGAWLLLPTVRDRIGYPGQRRDPAPIDLGTDQISSGILDPVLERGAIYREVNVP
jgi:hypothetical protein